MCFACGHGQPRGHAVVSQPDYAPQALCSNCAICHGISNSEALQALGSEPTRSRRSHLLALRAVDQAPKSAHGYATQVPVKAAFDRLRSHDRVWSGPVNPLPRDDIRTGQRDAIAVLVDLKLLERLERRASPTRYGSTALEPPRPTDFNVKLTENGESLLL
jgi:hypothetical protein